MSSSQTMGVAPEDLDSAAPYPVFISAKDLEDEYVRALSPAAVSGALQASGLWRHGQLQPLREGGANPEHEAVAAFCRHKRNKVLASIVIAEMLQEATASQVSSLHRLIESVRARG